MNRKNKYTIGWWIDCALIGIFFPAIGYQITTWQWWVGYALFLYWWMVLSQYGNGRI